VRSGNDYMTVASALDKIPLRDYILSRLANQVGSAKVVRVWDRDLGVDFDGVLRGVYCLKANHDSRYHARIALPCTDEELAHARNAANRWLASSYGEFSCHWWYGLIYRKVFLKESLTGQDAGGPLDDYRFHIINGKAAFLQLDVDFGAQERYNPIHDENLNYLPCESVRDKLHEAELPALAGRAQEIEIELGRNTSIAASIFT
jgi:hypothetical protein